ncbi:DUF1003 domain-containing protein [Streptacidiphilus melanogenes]|uniref:DUF1003 domain-containing protein n=1 Tax=Streptacidiphilus melanogenes TaxID=411235 RepID=UPI0005A844FB|nr:DUF1003 domain-containing protein [Streptacidiphilus melanogenes]
MGPTSEQKPKREPRREPRRDLKRELLRELKRERHEFRPDPKHEPKHEPKPSQKRLRLDQPQRPSRLALPQPDPDAFGRLSERIARFMGTGRFLVWMTMAILLWVAWNVLAPSGLRFDTYPFIFLTLALSLQASYAAPLILLAQNRQDDRDRVNMEQDRARASRTVADTEFLTREVAALRQGLGEVATRDFLRSELQQLLKELDSRDGDGHRPDDPRIAASDLM